MNIYIDYDSREDLAYQVCYHSIISNSDNAHIHPLKLDNLKNEGLYKRDEDKLGQLNYFFRFLVPYLITIKVGHYF